MQQGSNEENSPGSFLGFFAPKSRFGAKNEPQPSPKRGGLVRGRIQSGLPLTSGANPSCWADCQHQGTRAPGATFCDMVKYVLLRGKSGGWSTFGGIKSGPVEKGRDASSFFRGFLLPRPQKGVALVRGRIQSGLPLTSGADPSCPPGCQDQRA